MCLLGHSSYCVVNVHVCNVSYSVAQDCAVLSHILVAVMLTANVI